MYKNKLTILFYLQKNRTNKKGLCPIRGRMTYYKKRKEFPTGLFIKPVMWSSKLQKASVPKDDYTNNQLSLIKNEIYQVFLLLKSKKVDFNVSDIYNEYKGKTKKSEYGVSELYNMHSERLKKLVGIDIQKVTYDKYLESGIHLKDYIKWRFKQPDILLKDMKSNFLEEYEFYLKTEKKLQQSTINKAIQRFRRVVRYAVANEYLNRDPFVLYKAKRVKKEIVYLSVEELKALESKNFDIQRIQQIKNMFVFCCYSGLAFKEMMNLRKVDISKEFDGELWMNINRAKTNKSYKVPLLPKAKEIIEIYTLDNNEFVFPRISNPNFNSYLKEIADLVGIQKKLTHHIARKTFATTVLLYNNVPIEIVSKLLGHSKIQTTQDHYGEIVQKRISDEMKTLSRKFT